MTIAMQSVEVGPVKIGMGHPLGIIAGPCVIESKDLCMRVGEVMRDRCAELGLGYIFKASFDKANRSSIRSPRGPGVDDGLKILEQVRQQLGVPVTTDIHDPVQARAVGEVVDLLQIPAFLCRQTDLLLAAGGTGKPVNVKKGQFMSPGEMINVINKLRGGDPDNRAGGDPGDDPGGKPGGKPGTGRGKIMLTERGTFFGYHRLVNDFAGLGDMMELGCPVCFDATHSTQLPAADAGGSVTGGRPTRVGLLSRCAVAGGVQAVFIETHPDPEQAKSDAATMLPLEQTSRLLRDLKRLYTVATSLEL